jgi:hypothetical protein
MILGGWVGIDANRGGRGQGEKKRKRKKPQPRPEILRYAQNDGLWLLYLGAKMEERGFSSIVLTSSETGPYHMQSA